MESLSIVSFVLTYYDMRTNKLHVELVLLCLYTRTVTVAYTLCKFVVTILCAYHLCFFL